MFEHLAGQLALGILVMAALAVLLALCSEADAFVAASLSMLPLVPRLVFLVVGPAVDVKLFAMQAGMFGRAFAIRFAPATFVVATVVATAVGLLLLGRAMSRETENALLLLVGLSTAIIAVDRHLHPLCETGAAAVVVGFGGGADSAGPDRHRRRYPTRATRR